MADAERGKTRTCWEDEIHQMRIFGKCAYVLWQKTTAWAEYVYFFKRISTKMGEKVLKNESNSKNPLNYSWKMFHYLEPG